MAKDDSRRATPRTKSKPDAPEASSQKSAPTLPDSLQKRGGTRVVLSEADMPRTRTSSGFTAGKAFSFLGRAAIVIAVLAATCAIVFYILRMSSLFTIASIDTEATEHLSAEDIANLAGVKEGTTLLSLDTDAVVENLSRNPWVGDVEVHREFPDRIRIVVHERRVRSLVLMSTSAFAWYIGEGNVWLEPATLDLSDGKTAKDAAQELAAQRGALLIIDAPVTVNPSAGSTVEDDVLLGIDTYLDELPEEISSSIVYFSASSLEGISCVLSSGVEVSLGSPTQIEQKAAVLTEILEQHPGEITYVNVRVPSNPSYRRIDLSTVQPGTGA